MEERNALGITEVANDPTYDQRFYWGVDNPKDLAGLKTQWKATQSDICNSLLSPSDWRVTRAAELGQAVASAWLTYRGAVRSACNTRQTEINAVADVPALIELLFGQPTITRQQTDADGNGVVEPDTLTDEEGNETANPVAGEPVMETVTNPAIATAWPTPI